jgi:hypothetical protein
LGDGVFASGEEQTGSGTGMNAGADEGAAVHEAGQAA